MIAEKRAADGEVAPSRANGHGSLTNTSGFSSSLPFFLIPDPGPGGLASVLTYDTLNPPGLVAGDVLINSPGSGLEDVVRFNVETLPNGTLGVLLLYSSPFDGAGFDSLADTPTPPGAFYANMITLTENASGSVIYTPTAGQPGFVAGAAGPVTYDLVSTPEPSSLTLAGIATLIGPGIAWRRRTRAAANRAA
jgi:hypothetical protein